MRVLSSLNIEHWTIIGLIVTAALTLSRIILEWFKIRQEWRHKNDTERIKPDD